MALKEKTADGWQVRAGAVGCPFAVGGVYETLDSTETIETLKTKLGGTWEALPDRVEDIWKEYNCTCSPTVSGGITNLKALLKISEDKRFIDVQLSCNILITGISSTSVEWQVGDGFYCNGVAFKDLIGNLPMVYNDNDNESQTASFYFSGANKLWFGGNKTGNFNGQLIGRRVVPYNSAFTPDKVFKRFKRTA